MSRGVTVTGHTQHRRLVRAALRELAATPPGQPSGPAVHALFERLKGVIHAAVLRAVLQHGRGRVLGNLREEVEDHVQLVFGRLFERDAHPLRIWDPARGMSLPSWVSRFAALRARDALRSRARDPWAMDAMPPDYFEANSPTASHEERVATSHLYLSARARLLANQSDLGQRMFMLLFEEDCSTQEVRSHTGMNDGAIYQWRRRLGQGLREEVLALLSGPNTTPRTSLP